MIEFVIHHDKRVYALVNYEEVIEYLELPFYKKWLRDFPSWKKLAEASQIEVLMHWKGLGYNSRALRLHKLAKLVTTEYSGRLPQSREVLEKLPGIGPYTSGAICAFAYQQPASLIETNIRRVYLHHFFKGKENVNDQEILKKIQRSLPPLAREVSGGRRGIRDWYYALMDYGSYLAKTIPNPNRKSKHYAKQLKFEGSDRQIRGKILGILLEKGKINSPTLMRVVGEDMVRVTRVIRRLESEGFLKTTAHSIWLI